MKAIQVKYLGPTNVRGSRLKASDGDGNSVTISYDDSLSRDEAYRSAAVALCAKMHWAGADTLIGGGFGDTEVFVFGSRHCDCGHCRALRDPRATEAGRATTRASN